MRTLACPPTSSKRAFLSARTIPPRRASCTSALTGLRSALELRRRRTSPRPQSSSNRRRSVRSPAVPTGLAVGSTFSPIRGVPLPHGRLCTTRKAGRRLSPLRRELPHDPRRADRRACRRPSSTRACCGPTRRSSSTRRSSPAARSTSWSTRASCTTSAGGSSGRQVRVRPRRASRSLLHQHQADAIRAASTGANYVLTTGTGSGKSLAYIVPIVDHVLRNGAGRRADQGDRRLPDERAGEQPGERAGEVPEARLPAGQARRSPSAATPARSPRSSATRSATTRRTSCSRTT